MKECKVGFGRGDITPAYGIHLVGYPTVRVSDGTLDPLLASVLCLSDGEKNFLVISLDSIGMDQENTARMKAMIEKETAVPASNIFIACTHIHTGPALSHKYGDRYSDAVLLETAGRVAAIAKEAILDLAPATVYVNSADTPVEISFIRRFMMKNGKTMTNPGFLNPDIAYPLGEADHRVALTLFKRENKPEIALINFQVHPDVIGGTCYSADFPGFTRRIYEAGMPNSVCMYINGAQGDTNHFNVKTPENMLRHGYEFSQHMGRTIAGTAMSLHAMAEEINPLPLRSTLHVLTVEHNKAKDDEEIEWAKRIQKLEDEGRNDEISPPELGIMAWVTEISHAARVLLLREEPDEKELHVTGFRMGEFALVGFPGEPFTDIGRQVKNASPAKMTFAACCANGYEGYYPMQSAFDEGGYEARSSKYRAGTAEKLIKEGKSVLSELFAD